jgi:hypothetical protein
VSRLDGVSIKTSVQSIMQRTCGYNFLKHSGRFSLAQWKVFFYYMFYVIKENLPLCFKSFIHMFVALLIAQKFLFKLRQALTHRLSVGETMNIIAL